MGNCQAVDAATLIIQHPNGKSDKFYSPVNASQIMKTNPGHYVALLLSTTLYPNPTTASSNSSASSTAVNNTNNNTSLRITRIKLLRPTDTLLLGHAYRLITTQEVTKGLCAKKQAKLHKNQADSVEKRITENHQNSGGLKRSQLHKDYQVEVNRTSSSSERNRGRTSSTSGSSNTVSVSNRSRTWQPKLNSISEAAN